VVANLGLTATAVSAVVTTPATQVVNPVTTSRTQPATTIDQAVIEKIALPVTERAQPAYYWLKRPAGHGPGQRPPLLVCLHGTDDTAQQMVHFWAALQARLPIVMAAPRGRGKGWRETDLPIIRAMLADLQKNVSFDDRRVLLAGFSAGGAMTFQLLYAENFPATAVAALANYVPPPLTAEQIRAKRHIPAFYAVGMTDVNYERMRAGLELLRSAGANVELYRPPIGHVLDANVAQTALDWFFDQCARQQLAIIEEASTTKNIADIALKLERIVTQACWHEPEYVTQATDALTRIELPGRKVLSGVKQLIAENHQVEAIQTLNDLEDTYGQNRIGREAQALRTKLEADPLVQQLLELNKAQERADEALALYKQAQVLIAQKRLRAAADQCRRIVDQYSDTPSAKRAQYLLNLLEGRTTH